MIKKFTSLISAVLICLSLLPMFVINAGAEENYGKGFDGNSDRSTLVDVEYGGTGLFSELQKEDLYRDIASHSEQLQMNIMVWIGGSYRSDHDTVIFCDDTYDEIYGEDTDGIFYYIDLSGKSPACDHISTSGKAVLIYQDRIDSMFNNLDHYLPASGQPIYPEDIYDAVRAFLSMLETYANNRPSSSMAYYHDQSSGKYFYYKGDELIITKSKPPALWMKSLTIGIIIGLVVGLLVYFLTALRYRFKSSANPSVYMKNEASRFHEKSDVMLRSYVTKHRVQSDSGGGRSGGGGGGHSHSGGHGGGSHHR